MTEAAVNLNMPNVESVAQPNEPQIAIAPEGSLPEETKPEKKEIEFGARFAALARKERAVQEKERAFKEREQVWKAKAEKFETWEKEFETAKFDPPKAWALLESVGLTYKDVTDLMLKDREPTTDLKLKALQAKLEDFESKEKRKLEEAKAEAEKQRQAEVESKIEQYKQTIKAHVDNSGDTYELIRENDASDLVFEVIEEYWNANQELLPLEDACGHVEKELEDRARKLLGLKKLSPKSEPLPDKPSADAKTSNQTASPKTLTNGAVASAPPVGSNRFLSEDESKRRAAAMIRWT